MKSRTRLKLCDTHLVRLACYASASEAFFLQDEALVEADAVVGHACAELEVVVALLLSVFPDKA